MAALTMARKPVSARPTSGHDGQQDAAAAQVGDDTGHDEEQQHRRDSAVEGPECAVQVGSVPAAVIRGANGDVLIVQGTRATTCVRPTSLIGPVRDAHGPAAARPVDRNDQGLTGGS